MPYGRTRISVQLTGHADFWHPTGSKTRSKSLTASACPIKGTSQTHARRCHGYTHDAHELAVDGRNLRLICRSLTPRAPEMPRLAARRPGSRPRSEACPPVHSMIPTSLVAAEADIRPKDGDV